MSHLRDGENVASAVVHHDRLVIIGKWGTVIIGIWDNYRNDYIWHKSAELGA